ncbi:MAG: DUF4097 family beta strand repeat protein [Clostridia bacterium]|nr:DUF4097 family beta strand repeat protein [Clostridia bacterium]
MKRLIAMLLSAVVVLGVMTWCIFEVPGRPGWGGYSAGDGEAPATVQHIRIHCASEASVRVTPGSEPVIRFALTANGGAPAEETALQWRVRGKTLDLICNSAQPVECRVTVPQTLLLNDLDIIGKTVKGTVEDLVIRDLTLRAEAGAFTVKAVKCIDALVANTKRGALVTSGVSARRFDIKTTDGAVTMDRPVFQRDCKIITKAGDMLVLLPAGSMPAVRERHGSGSFENAFAASKTGMRFTLRTRSGRIRLSEPRDVLVQPS